MTSPNCLFSLGPTLITNILVGTKNHHSFVLNIITINNATDSTYAGTVFTTQAH